MGRLKVKIMSFAFLLIIYSLFTNVVSFASDNAINTESARYMGMDRDTRGDWIGKYGNKAYVIPYFETLVSSGRDAITPADVKSGVGNDSQNLIRSYSSKGTGYNVIENPSNDKFSLLYPNSTIRKKLNVYAYAGSPFQYTFNLNDQNEHLFSVYIYQPDASDQLEQKIELTTTDGATIINSIIINGLGQGKYITYKVKGSFTIKASAITVSTCALNAFFFDDLTSNIPTNASVLLSSSLPRTAEITWGKMSASTRVTIERSKSGSEVYEDIVTVSGALGKYIDCNLDAGTYLYRLRASEFSNYSGYTSIFSITTEQYTNTNITFEQESISTKVIPPQDNSLIQRPIGNNRVTYVGIVRKSWNDPAKPTEPIGNWIGKFGNDGYILPSFKAVSGYVGIPNDMSLTPKYITSYISNADTCAVISYDSSNPLAPQTETGDKRKIIDTYLKNSSETTFNFEILDNDDHLFTVYNFFTTATSVSSLNYRITDLLDNDLTDMMTLSGLNQGVYITYKIRGSFKFKVSKGATGTINPIIRGFFFDSPIGGVVQTSTILDKSKAVPIKVLVKNDNNVPVPDMTVSFNIEGKNVGGNGIDSYLGTSITNSFGEAVLDYMPLYVGNYVLNAVVQYDDTQMIGGCKGTIPLSVTANVNISVPVILKISEAVVRGGLISINGEDLGKDGLLVAAFCNPGQSTIEPPANAIYLEIVQTDTAGQFVVARLPDNAQDGIYDIWVKNTYGWSKPVKLNGAIPLWISECEVFDGLQIQLVGRNFDLKEFGLSDGHVDVRLTNSTGQSYSAPVNNYNPYKISFGVTGIPLGTYFVEVRNHIQGEWVRLEDGQMLTVVSPGADPLNLGVAWAREFKWDIDPLVHKYDVKLYGNSVLPKITVAKGDGITDDTVAVNNAILAAKDAGGGIVYFPNGRYCITSLKLYSGVVLLGQSKENTVILASTTDASDFISSATGSIGMQGVANLTIEPALDALGKSKWANGRFAIFLGNRTSVYPIGSRVESKVFVKDVIINSFTKYGINDGFSGANKVGFGIRERLVVKDCSFGIIGAAVFKQYAQVSGNTMEYPGSTTHTIADYTIIEKNTIKGHPESGFQLHGYSIRAKTYFAENTIEKSGAFHSVNDGESILNECPGSYFDIGEVLRADGLNLEVIPSLGLQLSDIKVVHSSLKIVIVGGRGIGQMRAVTGINGITGNQITIDSPWDVFPDMTSRYTLILPNEQNTIYKNTIIDCGGPVSLYGNTFYTVVAENIIKNSGGIAVIGMAVSADSRLNQGYFVRIDRNNLEDIYYSDKAESNKTGVFASTIGDYIGTQVMAVSARGNSIKGVNSNTAPGFINIVSGGLAANRAKYQFVKNVVFENNDISNMPIGIKITDGTDGTVIKDNSFSGVATKILNVVVPPGVGGLNVMTYSSFCTVSFKIGDRAITQIEAGSISTQVKISNNIKEGLDVYVLTVLLKDDKVVKTQLASDNLSLDQTKTLSNKVDVPLVDTEKYKIKVYIWDSLTRIKPLTSEYGFPI